ncbi:MAG: hypothetical protein IPJ03_06270 [Ignavibacteriales bacterium]|nr:hypothetical protein [Ignavibacteriales bacterium]
MKNILFHSVDFSLCYSFLMLLEDKFRVTTSTNLDKISKIADSCKFEALIIDAEPNKKVQNIILHIKKNSPALPIIMTYVFNPKLKDSENNLRNMISAVFYKPYDLNEVANKLNSIVESIPEL